MKFKNPKLNIINDVYDDVPIPQGKGGRFTKFYSLYVFKVLTEEASNLTPMRVVDIVESVKNNYNIVLSKDTVQEYLRLFNDGYLDDYELLGDPYEGFYLNNIYGKKLLDPGSVLDDNDINFLIQIVRRSKLLRSDDRAKVIKKLYDLASYDLKKFLEKNKSVFKDLEKEKQHQDDMKYLLTEDMVEIINEQRPIMLTRKFYMKDKVLPAREFYAYAILPTEDSYLIIGAFKGKKTAEFIPIGTIKDYWVKEDERFTKTPIKITPASLLLIKNDEWIETLKQNYAKDFIFPNSFEVSQLKQEISEARLEHKKNSKKEDK